MITKNMVGKRILWRRAYETYPTEAIVEEVTRGGNVKMRYPNGNTGWYPKFELEYIEVLEVLEEVGLDG